MRPTADLTLTLTYEDSVKVQSGELDANAAFMQGRMKVAGNMAKFMQLLPLTTSPEYQALQAQVRADHHLLTPLHPSPHLSPRRVSGRAAAGLSARGSR